ncbi:hypothetical protein [Microvirga tunisiensis]|nr:hypothetical protein [Microvirga tunisiensis]
MPRDKALALKDDQDETNELAVAAGLVIDHEGPYRIELEASIAAYFAKAA